MDIDEFQVTPLRLGNLARLAQRLQISQARLKELAEGAYSYYEPFDLATKSRWFSKKELKKPRPIDRPTGELVALQSRINSELLSPILMPEHIFGAVKRRTIFGNAGCHQGAKLLVTLDVKQCFPSITPRHIYSVWSKTLGCSPKIAKLLTMLTTFERRLPQGAPTSPALANLLIWSIDKRVRIECERLGVVYSTWLDDLAFSGDEARALIQIAVETFRTEGLKFSHRKIKIMGPKEVKTLTGTRAGRDVIRVPAPYCSQVRAGIHNLKVGRVVQHDLGIYIEQLLGRLRYINQVCPADARPLKLQLDSTLPFVPFEYRTSLKVFVDS
jgi:hypothetical protein